ncbi:MAG: VWA domain-containing protein [Candidatus Dadabacteria bacterium]|nr:MAG: VWA domain-containing protein [Candidatus Dadabacteria bacterium]
MQLETDRTTTAITNYGTQQSAVGWMAVLPALSEKPLTQKEILDLFSEEDRATINERLEIISALAKLVSHDYEIPIELNMPGQGWHWDFAENLIKADPLDILNKPLDFLRFVAAHEGAHRRISNLFLIPESEWRQPGYSFMTNAIEDPRANNFVLEGYPRFQSSMELIADAAADLQKRTNQTALSTVGFVPRFLTAGFEYMHQWRQIKQSGAFKVPADLDYAIKDVLAKTLDAANDSWQHYPLREELQHDSALSELYAAASYQINAERIWPEFKKLIELDAKDGALEELLKDFQGESGSQGENGIPQNLKDNLSEQELKELLEALMNAGSTSSSAESSPVSIPLASLSEELLEKLNEYFESLPDEKKQELIERALKSLADLEETVNQDLEKMYAEAGESNKGEPASGTTGGSSVSNGWAQDNRHGSSHSEHRNNIEEEEKLKRNYDSNSKRYRHALKRMKRQISHLERNLKRIFKDRKNRKWTNDNRRGKSVHIGTRIKEIAKGIIPLNSRAWRKRNAPLERDYAISIAVDLSGSMSVGNKIKETFQALVAVLEPLNKLKIKTEVTGFNRKLHRYKKFSDKLNAKLRAKLGGMVKEVKSNNGSNTNDGLAIVEASKALERTKVKRKILIIITDGQSNPSGPYMAEYYRVGNVLARIKKNTDQIVVALGIGKGTEYVEKQYPNGKGAINIKDLAKELSKLLEDLIRDDRKFRR